jgi:pimeloyl-ACP methyl ester carboxylesterase
MGGRHEHSPTGSLQDPAPVLVPSFDGSDVAVRSSGSGPASPLLFVNGVGATLAVWRKPLAELAAQRRWVTWDLRGLHDSPPPAIDRSDPGTHAGDALAVMDHLEIETFAVMSWSNGSRIAFEIAARHPDRVEAVSVVNGGHGQSFTRMLHNLEPSSALPLLAGVAKHFPVVVSLALGQLIARPELPGLIRQSGLLGRSIDPAPVIETLREMAMCDPRRLLATFEAVAGSPADELLPGIQPPTLLIAGGRDRLSPVRMSEEMRDLIPQARLQVSDDATHYLPLECWERLVTDVSGFLADSEGSLR